MGDIDYSKAAEEARGTWEEDYPKLTEWENEPTVAQLSADLTAANTYHAEHVAEVKNWLLLLDAPKLTHRDPKRSKHVSKLIRKHVEWRVSSLAEPFLSADDVIDAYPIGPSDKAGAEQAKLILNDQFNNRINKVRFINEVTRTLTEEGTAVLRSYWKEEVKTLETYEEVFSIEETKDPEKAQRITEIKELIIRDPDYAVNSLHESLIEAATKSKPQQELFYYPRFESYRTVTNEQKTANHPEARVCYFEDVIIDPTCEGDMSRAMFVAERVETSLSELEAEGMYHNLDLLVDNGELMVSGGYVWDLVESSDLDIFQYADLPRKRFNVTEYWGFWDIDATGTVVPIRAVFCGNVMLRLEENPYPDKKLPYTVIPYIPRRKHVYGVPDAELLEDNQNITSAIKRGIIDTVARNAVGQRGIRADALDPVNYRRYINGEDFKTNPAVDMRQAVYVEQYPEIPQTAVALMEMESMEAEALSGIRSFTGGISGQALGNTATGVRSALDATAKRDLDILNRIKAGIVDVARKFLSMSAVFLDKGAVVRITENKYVPIIKEQLVSNIDIRVTINTAEMENQQAEELVFMLQTLGPAGPREITQIILADIAKLRKRPDLAKQLMDFQPQPDPVEQRLRELEVSRAEAEVMKLQAEAEEAKAKAQKALADSRRQSQSTISEATGQAHRERVAEMGAQAEGNMKLAAFNKGLENASKESPLPANPELPLDIPSEEQQPQQ